jgi:hypothetical protein
MTKIFEFNGNRQGTFIDSVSKTAMTPTNVTFKRTEKGQSSFFSKKNATEQINTNRTLIPETGDFSIEAYINLPNVINTGNQNFDSCPIISQNENSFTFYAATWYGSANGNLRLALGSEVLVGTDVRGKGWKHIILTRNGNNWDLFVDNELNASNIFSASIPSANTRIGFSPYGSRKFKGFINKVAIYNHSLSEQERNKLYQEFLQSQPIEKPVRGFELVKPTDLSYQKDRGLLAAYNFKRNGNTLVDISGNGLNFTIPSGIHQNKDYLTFYNSDFIGYTSSPRALTLTDAQVAGRLNFTGNFTIMVRARVKNHSDFQGLVVKGTSSNGWRCYIDGANNKMRANLGNQIVSPSTAHTTMGNWNTFVYIFRPGVSIGFWLNGIDLGSVDITRTATTTNNDFIIGALQNNAFSADADFADVRIYNRELTEQEIKDYHNSFIKPVILEDWSGSSVGDVI